MIRVGCDAPSKLTTVASTIASTGARKVVAISPARFRLELPDCGALVEHIEWAEVIQYKHFYRLVQETDSSTLVVVNECLRTQSRHDLTYNCIRHFLNQTPHQVIFQRFPIIDSLDDLMTLVDFDTRSRWKREPFDRAMLADIDIAVERRDVTLSAVDVETDEATRVAYGREKRRLLDGIGLKDPHTIPRNLHLMAGKSKMAVAAADQLYVGRNARLGIRGLETYRDVATTEPRDVFEFCHNVIDFSDFLAVTGQSVVRALVSDLRVDRWYFDRFTAWARRVSDAYSAILG